MISITDKKSCCGCGACAQACGLNCITMVADAEGFLYPSVDLERCVECGACEKACPVLHPEEKPEEITVFAARCSEEEIRKASSSGGVFSLLAEAVMAEGGAVFGAAFDGDFLVAHKMARNRQELGALMGSKYLQSRIGDTYLQAEALLKSGTPVLYTGTGCQIAGLKTYLKKEYDNLYTVEVLCHGVPSPRIWQKYLQWQKEKHQGQILAASFRDKSSGWRQYSLRLDFDNGCQYSKPNAEEPYTKLFLSEICLRPSCHDCKFRESRSGADLTIGDAWGIEKWMPEMDDDKGTSIVIVNTPKGQALLERVREYMELQQADAETVLANNMVYRKSVRPHPNRKKFFTALQKGASLEELLQLCRRPLWYRILHLGYRILRKMKKILQGR